LVVPDSRSDSNELLDCWIAQWANDSRALAGELHDEVGPALATLRMVTAGMSAGMSAGGPQQIELLLACVARLEQWLAARKGRNLVGIVQRLGLSDAMQWLLGRAEERTGAVLGLSDSLGPERVAMAVEVALFGASAELLDRLVLRAEHHGTVSLGQEGGSVSVQVRVASSPDNADLDVADLSFGNLVIALGGKMVVDQASGSRSVTVSVPSSGSGRSPGSAAR
jgi:hypothetical protein